MREIVAVGITSFKRDAVVKCYLNNSRARERKSSKRSTIKEFSSRSRSRLLFTAFNASCEWLAFGVLTYPNEFPMDGKVVKRHINLFRKRLQERGIILFWAIEFQVRGAVHVNFLLDSFLLKDELSRIWFEIVGSGDEKHLRAGTQIAFAKSSGQASGYMAACYSADKSKQKEIPAEFQNIGRWWGAPRGLVKPVSQDIMLLYDAMPKVRALRKFTEKSIKPRKVQPMRDEKKRKRKVKRKVTRFLHGGLQGFKVFKGSKVAQRLTGDNQDGE